MEGIGLEEGRVFCEREVLEGVLGVLLVGTGDFGLAFEKSVLGVLEKDRLVSSGREGLFLCTGRWGGKVEVEAGTGDGASVAGGFGASAVRECEDVFGFRNVCAVAGNDWVTLAEDTVSVAKGEADERGREDGLEEVGDGKMGELEFGIAGDVGGSLWKVVTGCGGRGGLEGCWDVAEKSEVVLDALAAEGV